MQHDLLVGALNDLQDRNSSQMETVAASGNAVIEKRIAAILWLVAGSRLAIAGPTLDLIGTLTDPNWNKSVHDPLETPVGKSIAIRVLKAPDEPARTAVELVTEKLRAMSKQTSPVPDMQMDYLIRRTTGRPAMWWIEWIRQT